MEIIIAGNGGVVLPAGWYLPAVSCLCGGVQQSHTLIASGTELDFACAAHFEPSAVL